MATPNQGFTPPDPFQQPNQQPAHDETPAPAPDLQRPPVGAPGGPATTPTTRIPLDFEEYKRLTGLEKQFEEMQRLQQLEIEAKEEQRLRALADKGNIEEAFSTYKKGYEDKLATFQTTLQQRETSWLNAERTRAIGEALSGVQFVGEDPSITAKMVRVLLEGEVEAVMGKDGLPVIRDRERGRPALEYLKERLESPEFSIFMKAKQRGGAGTDGTRTSATQPQAPGPPLTPEQAVVAWQRSQGTPSFGLNRKRSG